MLQNRVHVSDLFVQIKAAGLRLLALAKAVQLACEYRRAITCILDHLHISKMRVRLLHGLEQRFRIAGNDRDNAGQIMSNTARQPLETFQMTDPLILSFQSLLRRNVMEGNNGPRNSSGTIPNGSDAADHNLLAGFSKPYGTIEKVKAFHFVNGHRNWVFASACFGIEKLPYILPVCAQAVLERPARNRFSLAIHNANGTGPVQRYNALSDAAEDRHQPLLVGFQAALAAVLI